MALPLKGGSNSPASGSRPAFQDLPDPQNVSKGTFGIAEGRSPEALQPGPPEPPCTSALAPRMPHERDHTDRGRRERAAGPATSPETPRLTEAALALSCRSKPPAHGTLQDNKKMVLVQAPRSGDNLL